MKLSGLAAVVAVTVVALSGCGSDNDTAAQAAPGPTSPAASAPAASTSGLGSVKNAGVIPDPCKLLASTDVVALTGRAVSRTDPDGLQSGEATRYCQWQQTGGQLDVFLNRTSAADFDATVAGAAPVAGVGEKAFSLSGHLYVLYGTVCVDVYARGGSDPENLEIEKKIATVLIPKI